MFGPFYADGGIKLFATSCRLYLPNRIPDTILISTENFAIGAWWIEGLRS